VQLIDEQQVTFVPNAAESELVPIRPVSQ